MINDIEKAFGNLLACLWLNGTINKEELKAVVGVKTDVPHFYTAFYVFQYATGFSSAVAIASHIVETGDAEGYLKFLTTGGSDYPLNELKLAGVDLTSPQPVKDALKVFADSVRELKALLAEL